MYVCHKGIKLEIAIHVGSLETKVNRLVHNFFCIFTVVRITGH